MKLISWFVTVSLALLFVRCEGSGLILNTLCTDDAKLLMTIPAQNELSLIIPECFSIIRLQGIDSQVGKIVAPSHGLTIRYDIGFFAGEYIRETSPNQTTVYGGDEIFRYEEREGRLIFTFPNAGPANFYTEQLLFEDDLIEIFKTLRID